MSAREWGPELHAGDEWEGDGMRVRIISVTPIGLARATLTCEPRDRIYGLRCYPWGRGMNGTTGVLPDAYPSTVAAFVACYGLRKVQPWGSR